MKPEEKVHQIIDAKLIEAGWVIQNRNGFQNGCQPFPGMVQAIGVGPALQR